MIVLPQDLAEPEVRVPTVQDEWLDYLQSKRDALIMELRAIERPLVQHGRLRNETLPRRIR